MYTGIAMQPLRLRRTRGKTRWEGNALLAMLCTKEEEKKVRTSYVRKES